MPESFGDGVFGGGPDSGQPELGEIDQKTGHPWALSPDSTSTSREVAMESSLGSASIVSAAMSTDRSVPSAAWIRHETSTGSPC